MPTLTLNDLDQRVLDRLDNNTLLYGQVERYEAINSAIRTLNAITGFLQTSIFIPGSSVANRIFYDVPAGILFPLRVQFERNYLGRSSVNSIGQKHPNWTQGTTANTGLPVTYWIPLGFTKFAIYPADALGGGDILVTGVQEPVPLVNPSDQISWPNELTGAFDLLAAHTLQLKESTQIFAQASKDYQGFMRMAKQITILQGLKMPSYFLSEGNQPKQG
jgi:hypothetical protein